MNDHEAILTIHFEHDSLNLHTEHLEVLFEAIAQGESLPSGQQVDLIFCGEETITRLNTEFRQKPSVTDVLSFPFGDDDFLGEIYICVPRAIEQAKEYQLTLEEESARLFVHGMIHLLGFDHLTESERLVMEEKEKTYFTVE